MEENVIDSSKTSEVDQSLDNELIIKTNETLNNDNNTQDIVEQLNVATINDSVSTEVKQECNDDLANNENSQNTWTDSTVHDGNKDDSKHYKKRRGSHKSSYNNNSEKSWGSTSNNFENYRGHAQGRGRGRGYIKRSNDENQSFGNGYNQNFNNHDDNTTHGHRGRGRGRGRGGRIREKVHDGWYGNNEDGHKKIGNDKSTGPKAEYIPPDIESEESISGIEAGVNFDKYAKNEVKVSGTDLPKRLTSFHASGLRDILLENVSKCNFVIPTPIQNYALPIIMAGRDLMASAQTGSGKTAAYVLPILHNLLNDPSELIFDENHCEPHVVIMAPTRELVIQICECVWKFSKGTIIMNGLLYGGTSIGHQKSKILQRGIHILTATPGRLNDFVEKGIVTFSSVKFFVLDEADRMLDMGFKPEIERILKHPTMTFNDIRQTVMFSATFASEIQHMATAYLKPDYVFVAVGEVGEACKDVVQTVLEVTKFEKKTTLVKLLKEMEDCQGTIVFVEQKRVADYIAAYLCDVDIPTTSIHGDRQQPERELALRDFKTNKMKVLVATAVAARGLDIKGVNNVVNMDLPKTIDEYVHQIGRTGRLGNAGKAISFFNADVDGPLASELIRILAQAEQEVPPWLNDVANRVQTVPAIDSFDDIRMNVNETETEESWE